MTVYKIGIKKVTPEFFHNPLSYEI